VRPLVSVTTLQFLLLRFVLLELILRAWSLVESLLSLGARGVFLALVSLFGLSDSDGPAIWVFVIVTSVPRVIYWVLLIGLGWPLLKDVASAVGLDSSDLTNWRALRSAFRLQRRRGSA
jgi:hypothetical protein